MPSDLQYRLLGPVEVRCDGRPLRLGPPKARVLLGYLLLHVGEVVSTDRLTDTLWGETPPASAGHALQVYVSGLRAVLEPDRAPSTEARVLRTRRPGYQLTVDPERVDVHRFEQLVERGRVEAAAGRAEGAAARLSDALALWRGPALADLSDEPFAAAAAGRLEELRLAATEDRVDAELALGRHADVVAGLSALIREHPLRERLHGQLMTALYRCGRQAEALRVFRELVAALDEEGLRASPWLRDLEVAILRHEPDMAPPPQAAAVTVPTPDADEVAPTTLPSLIRTVSVLHIVLVLDGGAEPDGDLAAALAEIVERLARGVEQHGGTVADRDRDGDTVTAVFGRPDQHEDDAERAVRAAFGALRACW